MSTATGRAERARLYQTDVKPHIPFQRGALDAFLAKYSAFDAPASTRYHGAWPGGWFDHSLCVMRQLVLLTERNGLKWARPESPYIVGFLHDVCKLDQYTMTAEVDGRPQYAFNGDTLYKGHGDKSVLMLAGVGQLTPEECACIRYHQGAFTDRDQWADFTRAIHLYPNVLWTHTADMIAAHVCDI